jgi:HAE1 family hydrophobic/amphiphilic exporter-1
MTVVISNLLSLLFSFTIIPWLSSRFGKLEHIEGKQPFEKQFLVSKVLTRFTNWVTEILNWCFDPLHQNYFSCSRTFFSSTIGLVGGGFGGEIFCGIR